MTSANPPKPGALAHAVAIAIGSARRSGAQTARPDVRRQIGWSRRRGRQHAVTRSSSTEHPRRRRSGERSVVSDSLALLGLVILLFLADLVLVSSVEHARAQRVSYASLRAQLSAVTAPTGQLDVSGRPLALGTPVAYMSIPFLGLQREVVFEGTTSAVLAKGPGHRRSSVLPGQAGVAILYGRAWSHGGPFGGAEKLPVGSSITVTTGQGEHSYQVTGVRRKGSPVPPPPDRAKGEGRLTLVTAAGPPFVPSEVVYVDAALQTPAVPGGAGPLGPSSMLAAEAALAADRTAWPAVFLLLQALAFAALGLAWASRAWGGAQAWLVGVPVVGLLAVLASGQIQRLLPNLL